MGIPDRISRRWLDRTANPYRHEVAAIAESLGRPGGYVLNLSYEWACTTMAAPAPDGEGMRLLRTLDWDFVGLGRYVCVVRQAGPAGAFLNVTWPGYAGVLTAMAPGRFAAALNQAPMRRRLGGRLPVFVDMALNPMHMLGSGGLPPSHLLRHVFETCGDFATARAALETTPIAMPTLFTLAGVAPGQKCLIERTETAHRTFEIEVCVANDWREPSRAWLPRGTSQMDVRDDNPARVAGLSAWRDRPVTGSEWVTAPVLNASTRLAVVANAAQATLTVQGFEPQEPGALPSPATDLLEVP